MTCLAHSWLYVLFRILLAAIVRLVGALYKDGLLLLASQNAVDIFSSSHTV